MTETPDPQQVPAPPANPFGASEQAAAAVRTSKQPWIWLVAVLSAVLLTCAVIWYVSERLAESDAGNKAVGGSTETDGSTEAEASDGKPEPGGEDGVEWPENMLSGGILFTGGPDGIDVVRSGTPAGGSGPDAGASAEAPGGATSHVRIYLDYRCPYCAHFEAANASTLEQIVMSGETVVEIVPLTFLDRLSAGSSYSSRAAAAMACVADAQPEAAWDAHAGLLGAGFQPPENTPGHDNATIVDRLDAVTDGLNGAARSCIEHERFVPFAQALNAWVFEHPVPLANDPALQVTGTPFALVNGVPYPGDPSDGAAFRAFLAEQGVTIDATGAAAVPDAGAQADARANARRGTEQAA